MYSLWHIILSEVFVAPPENPGCIQYRRSWLLEVERMLNEPLPKPEDRILLEERRRNLWRLPFADIALTGSPRAQLDDKTISQYRTLTGEIPPPSDQASDGDHWVFDETLGYRLAWRVYGRRAFITADGLPGLGPAGL
jgi:hypothetical protein